jgi:hypothetical protein
VCAGDAGDAGNLVSQEACRADHSFVRRDPLTEDSMTATPKIWKSLTQVNATDSGPNGDGQLDGQIAALKDGGYVVIWGDSSGVYNPSGTAIVAQRYDSAGNKVGGEVNLSNGFPGSASSPAVTILPNGNLAVAFVGDLFNFGFKDTFARIFSPQLALIRTDTIDSGQRRRAIRRSPPWQRRLRRHFYCR